MLSERDWPALIGVGIVGVLGGIASAELARRVPERSKDSLRLGSFRYIIGALVGAVLLVADVLWIKSGWLVIIVGLWMLVLEAVSLVDIECYLLPKKIILPAIGGVEIALALLALTEGKDSLIVGAIAGAVVGFTILLALWRITHGNLGFGDVRLGALCGAMEGFIGLDRVVIAIVIGFFVAAIVSLILIALRRVTLKSTVPFGPFLALGAVVSVLAHPGVVR